MSDLGLGDRPRIRLERNSDHQRYYLKDGTQVSGASSIAKLGDSPEGLIHWSWKLGMEGRDYKKVRDSAADSGTIAHFMSGCYLVNSDPDLREFTEAEISLAKPSYDKFLDFWQREQLIFIAQEEQLVHETLRFGGTIDLRARDEHGQHVLIDWKSSKALYDRHRRQIGGYELLANFNYPLDPIQRRAIVRIGRDPSDSFHVLWITDEKAKNNMRIFEAQANLYNVIADTKYGKRK